MVVVKIYVLIMWFEWIDECSLLWYINDKLHAQLRIQIVWRYDKVIFSIEIDANRIKAWQKKS